MNALTLVNDIARQFSHLYQHPEEQQQVAWWLLQTLTHKKKAELLAHDTIELSPEQQQTLDTWINEHRKRLKPLQYIIGSVPFAELQILVEPPVLIPRPETEEWTIELIKHLQTVSEQNLYILDLATGSGCIALALAHALLDAKIVGTDISEPALELARKNAHHNHLHNVEFVKSDLYTGVPHDYKFDLIVANPPYIEETEWDKLSPMVRKWEDKKALVASQQGLACIKEIIQRASNYLKYNAQLNEAHIPQLWIEIGYQQGAAVKELVESQGFVHVAVKKDLSGKDRVVTGGRW